MGHFLLRLTQMLTQDVDQDANPAATGSTGKPEASGCEVDQFHCSNGKCVPDWWRCNQMDECGDNSDEELCLDSTFSFQPCSLDHFPCLSRYTRIYTCLPHSLRCDGSIDCQVEA